MFFSVVWKADVFKPAFFKPKLCAIPFPNVLCIPKKMTYETENYEKRISKRTVDTGKEKDIFCKRLPECGSSSLSEGPVFINIERF